jgi:hypothetical protein
MSFTIVGKKFTKKEFEDYCKTIAKQSWVEKIVLHNTASPSLAQRPGGILTAQHIKNLHTYYEDKGWNGGPHLFIDATGIWVFNPLTRKGVHSPSYNSTAWGVEMLGNYQVEAFDTGLGAQVADNAQHAIACLAQIQGWKTVTNTMILHKEDPKTTHKTCPGKNVSKTVFINRVNEILKPSAPELPKISVIAGGKLIADAYQNEQGLTFVPLRTLCDATGLSIQYDGTKNQVTVENPKND